MPSRHAAVVPGNDSSGTPPAPGTQPHGRVDGYPSAASWVEMERTLEALSSYTSALTFADLPPETVHQAKRLLIDTIGCAVGALDAPSVQMARSLAEGSTGDRAVDVLGGGRSNVEWATFVNGILMRYLDFNDFTQAAHVKTGGHPSDTFAAGLATAAMAKRDGRALILSAVLGWEIYAKTSDAVTTMRIIDQGSYASIAAACIAAKMFDLSKEETANAIAIAAVANISALQSRYGEVSMWKSCAVPYACKNGVEAALLASRGMTGPDEAFEGMFGVFKISTGSFDSIGAFGGGDVPHQIMLSSIKHFPIGSVAQTAIESAMTIRDRLSGPEDIQEVNIKTFSYGHAVMATPDKWRPRNRETADHSMPYGVALGLLYGTVELKHFTDEYLTKPEIADMLAKIKIETSPELDAIYPEQRRSIVEIVTNSGERHVEAKSYHRGHPNDPMSDAEIEAKFRSLAEPHLGKGKADELLGLLWDLENVPDVGRIAAMTQP
jgi:2-methylcitrate dehydratase